MLQVMKFDDMKELGSKSAVKVFYNCVTKLLIHILINCTVAYLIRLCPNYALPLPLVYHRTLASPSPVVASFDCHRHSLFYTTIGTSL